MVRTLNIEQLEALEPRLKALVERQGQIVLTHNGDPVAVLVPVEPKQQADDEQSTQPPGR